MKIFDFLEPLPTAQELDLHQNNERETNFTASKIDSTKITNEDSSSKIEKEAAVSQPKTLQQEFSLININIPNIEVYIQR